MAGGGGVKTTENKIHWPRWRQSAVDCIPQDVEALGKKLFKIGENVEEGRGLCEC